MVVSASLVASVARRASSLEAAGRKDDRLREICREVGASRYLSALGSAAYISASDPEGAFAGSGIALSYQHYKHPDYPQGDKAFMPYLGIVDLIAHAGPEQALSVIRKGRRPDYTPGEAQNLVSAA